MAPKKRDRQKQSAPQVTLHNFFSKPSPRTGPRPTVTPDEVIVIESDSDDEVEIVACSTIKRRRLSPRNDLSSSSTPSKPPNRNGPPHTLDELKENEPSAPTLTFGKPILLVQPEMRSPVKEETTTPLTFGPSTLVARNDVSVAGNDCSPPLADSTVAETIPKDGAPEPMKWEIGDDEFTLQPQVSEEEKVEELLQETSGDVLDLTSEEELPKDSQMADDTLLEWDEEDVKLEKEDDMEDKPGPSNLNKDAFSLLMTSFKENEAWKEASEAERSAEKAKKGRRKAPFYKVLQGMPIAVDAFRYGAIPGVTAYFLTHAHSDHYTNLSSSWKHGPIYCSQGTANLIIHMLSVDKAWVHPLPMDVPTEIPNTNGVTVTLIEANHCPGSCLFLFEGRQTVNAGDSNFKSSFVGSTKSFRYLHCGDFRASPRHIHHPAVRGKHIDHVYLDTTYLDPRYTFPAQPLVIDACAELAERLADTSEPDKKSFFGAWSIPSGKEKGKERESRPLFVVGTYSIGKERVVKAIARALQSKIYCDARKSAILRCQDDPDLHSMITSKPLEASVHLVPLGTIASDRLKEYLDRYQGTFTRVIGFRPTGWTYAPPAGGDVFPSISTVVDKALKKGFGHLDLRPSPKSTAAVQIYPVPYSEHSSFSELTCFAISFNWTKMIATVNVGSESSRSKMAKWVSRWEAERKRQRSNYEVPHRHPDYW